MDDPLFVGAGPRVYAMPPGADFAGALVAGLKALLAGRSPEAAAGVTIYLNTLRMRERVAAVWAADGALFLPQLRLVTDIGRDALLPGVAPPVPALRRRLEAAAVLAGLIDRMPGLAPRSTVFDLAESLTTLMDEMQGEGVPPDRIAGLEVGAHAAHWQRTQAILAALAPVLADPLQPDAGARQRLAVAALAARWADDPPPGPVIVAGSTGSLGATVLLMQAVAALPQGALVLPGVDDTCPAPVWQTVLGSGDHPQARIAQVLAALELGPQDLRPWPGAAAPDPARNAVLSLALRPAPVTDQWLRDGPLLGDLGLATQGMTLIEAAGPRDEAVAVALVIRAAVEDGRAVALVTPDRGLARQVAAALDRWRIRPDDSAGTPLIQSAPGRLLLQVADVAGGRIAAEALVALLKHPLVAAGEERGAHLRLVRRLELHLRRNGPPQPDATDLADWARGQDDAAAWSGWVAGCLVLPPPQGEAGLADHVAWHLALCGRLAAGPSGGQGRLWDGKAGEAARAVMDALAAEAGVAHPVTATEYRALLAALLDREEVREPAVPHPGVLFLGTREARGIGAPLVILAGLNEGIWPPRPGPDPWLNRAMRASAGLLLPEREIGLSAHDFQQAVAAPEVVLTRARRDADAETVASRWLNRLTNLMTGLPGGKAALEAMKGRGDRWLALARADETPVPVPPARRPAPRPPVEARPRELPVTRITTLLRDPYAVYARHVLGLEPLPALRAEPDARLRGTVLHRVMEAFARDRPDSEDAVQAARRLRDAARAVLARDVPWPDARALWQARIDRVADFVVTVEAAAGGTPVVLERGGGRTVDRHGFRLTARPDRIDRLPDGRVQIFDYKTGTLPSKPEQQHFDKQLPLTAAIAAGGGFDGLGPEVDVAQVVYLGLGSKPVFEAHPLAPGEVAEVWNEFCDLVTAWSDRSRGYTSRRAPKQMADAGDYDHLARYGEWGMTDDPEPGEVG